MGKNQKKVKQKEKVSNNKQVKEHADETGSYLNRPPLWSFSYLDENYHKWGFTHAEDLYFVIDKLKSFENMTWGEINKASGARKHGNNNHFVPVNKLASEAQKRLNEIKRYEFADNIYSLHLMGTHRLYGVLLSDGIFRIIWYDQQHEIYPMSK